MPSGGAARTVDGDGRRLHPLTLVFAAFGIARGMIWPALAGGFGFGEGWLARTVTLRTLSGAGQRQKYEVSYSYNAQGAMDTTKYRVNGGSWVVSRQVWSAAIGQLTRVRAT